jgi:multimeric flavodoxin WrbA
MLKAKNVVVIFGSPRKNGNTHILVEEACQALSSRGIGHEIFFLNNLKIQGCQACYYCKRKNVAECAIQDDMQMIYAAIKKSDGLLIASPIYFGGVTAQTKLWVDRMFPFIDMNVRSLMPKSQPAAFIFTQNQPRPGLFANYIAGFKEMVGYLGFAPKGSLLACDLDKGYKPMVTENPELMRQAYALGHDLLA